MAQLNITLNQEEILQLLSTDHAKDAIEPNLNATKLEMNTLQERLETAKVEVQKEFPQEAELQTKSTRLQELNSLLNMDEKDDAILDDSDTEIETEKQARSLVR